MNNQPPKIPRKRTPIDPLTRKHSAQLDLRGQETSPAATVSKYVTKLEPIRRQAVNVLDLRPVKTILTSPAPPRRRRPVDTGELSPTPAPVAVAKPQPRPKAAVKAVRGRKSLRSRVAGLSLNLLIVVVAVTMAFSSTAGQVIIGLYGLVVIFKRLDSRGPFIVALVMLVAIPLFQLINLADFSENAAIYAYELMVVGVVEAIVETWREGRGISRTDLREKA